MKSSTFVLSFFGFCVFYICNADWIDELYERLVEDYLGNDYEEVAPFISSVTAGAEEFDRIIAELTKSKRKWYQPSVVLALSLVVVVISAIITYQNGRLSKGHKLIKACREIPTCFIQALNSFRKNKVEIQNSVADVLESKLTRSSVKAPETNDDVPVELLWKGGSLVESSCNVRNDTAAAAAESAKILQVQKQLLQSKLLAKCTDLGGGDEQKQVSPASSDESTAIRMAEIRKLLESEPEIMRAFMNEEDATNKRRAIGKLEAGASVSGKSGKIVPSVTSLRRMCCRRPTRGRQQNDILEEDQTDNDDDDDDDDDTGSAVRLIGKFGNKSNRIRGIEAKNFGTSHNLDSEGAPDPKLMNRIRLLESRLRLEELKNKNWINRMSRAEGILQQLNKQVERIEETRPVETRTETLKITSTVTNWASSVHPRKNTQFTLVNQYQPFYLDPPCMSLSEVIKKEIGFPSVEGNQGKPVYPIVPTPNMPALSSLNLISHSSILSKFLSR